MITQTQIELMAVRHLRLNDPAFIHQYYDIPYDFARDACSRYQTAMSICEARGDVRGFETLEKIILMELDAEAQKHD
jgi:hypothetical protein